MEDIDYLKKQISIIINLYNTKRFLEVISKGKVLIKKFPQQIILYNATSLSLSSLGKNIEALDLLKKALQIQSNNIHVINNIGLIHNKLNDLKKAREYYERALSINENFLDSLVNLGNLELLDNRLKKSKSYLTKALTLSKSPQTDEVIQMALGNYNQQTGEFNEAIKNFQIVNKLNPDNTAADKSISLIHKYVEQDDPHLLSMEAKLTRNLNEESSQRLYFALGKAHEDLKNHKKSFKYLMSANKIADKEAGYKINNDLVLFKEIKKLFQNFDENLKIVSEKKIIFILGMPRSGTTLAEQIISAHSKVFGAGELNILGDSIQKTLIENNKFVHSLKEIPHAKLLEIQQTYFNRINSFNYKESFLTDKAPLNFRWIGFIKIMFPNAKIVHCDRNPMDVCYSNFKNSFQSYSLSFCYDLKKLGTFYNLYKDLMLYWNQTLPDFIYNLSYEKLIENQKHETEKLLQFCDLDWDDNCMNPHKNKKIVATASLAQVRSPIYKSSVRKWENYADELSELKKIIS